MDAINDGIQYLISSLSLGGLYALMALGLVIVYGILRLVNFAYGELVMIGGYGLLLFGDSPLPWIIVALLSVIAAVIAGVLMERIAFRPVRDDSPTTMLITSFAVSTLLQSVALLTISPRPRAPRLPSIFVESFTIGGLRIKIVDLIGIIIGVLALVALTVFLRRTVIGLALRAAADDFTMTRLLGVPANRVIAAAFAISGLMAGIVALFWIGRTGQTYPTVGLQPVLIAFIASVVGGMESLKGAVLGGYVLGFLTMGLQTWLPQGVQQLPRRRHVRDRDRRAPAAAARIDPPRLLARSAVSTAAATTEERTTRRPAVRPFLRLFSTPLILVGAMLLIALFTVYRGDVVFDRVVTVMFINLLLTVGLQIFMGNSGLGSFGQYAFVTIGAYASIWFSLTPQQKALALPDMPKDWWLYGQHQPFLVATLHRGVARRGLAAGSSASRSCDCAGRRSRSRPLPS